MTQKENECERKSVDRAMAMAMAMAMVKTDVEKHYTTP